MNSRRDTLTQVGSLVLMVFAGCLGNSNSDSENVGGQNQETQERVCTDARVDSVEWDYTLVSSEDKDTAITEVTNYADVGGEITLEISVWGQKDYEELLDTEKRTRRIGPQSSETYELKFYPTEGIESISVDVTDQACTYK